MNDDRTKTPFPLIRSHVLLAAASIPLALAQAGHSCRMLGPRTPAPALVHAICLARAT